MDLGKDFRKFANSEGIASTTLDSIEASLTPYILEEREMRATQIDIFSRLMRDRILWVSGVVDQRMSDVVQAQLLYLDQAEKKDINMYINSPGGSVSAGLAIYDTMQYVKNDISTICIGMGASMAQVLLCAGTKGKRYSLTHSRILMHQPMGGTQGQASDIEIYTQEMVRIREDLYNIIAKHTGKSKEQIKIDADRDKYLSAQDALEYGIIDQILVNTEK